MLRDPYDQVISTEDLRVKGGIEDFVLGFLGNETRVTEILKIAAEDNDCALAQAYAAALMLMTETPAAQDLARPFLVKAQSLKNRASLREQCVVEAVRAWYAEDIPRAMELGEHLAQEYPAELCMAKITQNHYFNYGDAPGMLRIAEQVMSAHPEDAHAHAMLAFGYEQCHLLDEAETAAWRALKLKAKEPWAQHALAHVFLTRGQTDTGIQFLEEVSDTWTNLNSFMYTHNWWHLCLFYLNRDRYNDVLVCFDEKLWDIAPEFSQDQIGAVSMLLRMEHHGIDVGDRWQSVAHYLLPRVEDHVNPFLDLQYLYGLARADKPEADQMLRHLMGYAERAPEFERARWLRGALPAARGLMAHARGEWQKAVLLLEEAFPHLYRLGGSHAQRALFDLVLLDARMKAGEWGAAQQMLELQRQHDEKVPHTWRLLAQAYTALELPQEAERALAAVTELTAATDGQA